MSSNKDQLGDTLKKKEKAEEDRYFAEQDKANLEKMRAKREESERVGTHPTCPRCGKQLTETDRRGVTVDVCESGCGMWLDKGELELIAKRENDSWLGRLLGTKS